MVIDDKFSGTVQDYIVELTKNGIPVLYWDGDGDPPESVHSVRFILLDLDLTGGAAVDYPEDPARALGLIPGPFAVLIVSVDPTPDSADRLAKAYSEVNAGKELPGVIIKHTIRKSDKIAEDVVKYIKSMLNDKPVFESLLLVEQSLEHGKDASLAELAQQRFEATIKAWVKSIASDTGDISIAREFAMSLVRFQTRHLRNSSTYPRLKSLLKAIADEKVSGVDSLNSRIMHYRAYYEPDFEELPWTGDIYETGGTDPKKTYAVLVTPACEIAQGEASYMTFCYGFVLLPEDLENKSHLIFSLDEKLKHASTKEAKGKYFKTAGLIPRRFGVLENFRILEKTSGANAGTTEKFVRLFLDFQALESIVPDEIGKRKWKRLYRLDPLYVGELLEKFGSYSARIGTPGPVR
jgi:hypothetical protein